MWNMPAASHLGISCLVNKWCKYKNEKKIDKAVIPESRKLQDHAKLPNSEQ